MSNERKYIEDLSFFQARLFFRELNLLPRKLRCFLKIDAGFTMEFPFRKGNFSGAILVFEKVGIDYLRKLINAYPREDLIKRFLCSS